MRLPDDTLALLPWHQACWQRISRARDAGRLPHALLVTGIPGVGKRQFVASLACSLLCPRVDVSGLACGHCRECDLLRAGTHPDYFEIGPDADSKSDEIKVDAIRRLTELDALTSCRGGYKVVVIDPAQNMNLSAANSLLKTLEEPSPDTLLCLVCEQPERLPATVRSRCQELKLPVPSESAALEWLHRHTDSGDIATLLCLAQGAPLKALALLDDDQLPRRFRAFGGFAAVASGRRDPIAEAAAWNEHEPTTMLKWIITWIGDILRLASGHPAPVLANPDKVEELRKLSRLIDPATCHSFLQQVLAAWASERGVANKRLLYESLLVQWARIARPRECNARRRG